MMAGSFLNVLIHRLPLRRSVVTPRSSCPACGVPILPRDNVPVVSYLLLRGRCRACGSGISAQYPAVEAATGGLFLAAALSLPTALAALAAPFLAVLVAAAVIDLRHGIIPNGLVYPSLAAFAAAVLAASLSGAPLSSARAGAGLLAYGGGLLFVAVVSRGGMGMGDVKLAGLIGLVLGALGWSYVAVAAFAAVLLGGVGGLAALAAGRRRRDAIPFGPYLAAGAAVATFAAPHISSWYLAFVR